MPSQVTRRDYSLVGRDSQLAEELGLANAEWYASPIPRKRLKELMQRRDGPAIRDTLIWFGLMAVSGGLGAYFWGTWWCVPCFLVYGVLYCSASDSRWHECSHGTPFKTRWMNDAIYELASFMVMRESTPWRWSHTRHHTDTIIVGRDPEIAVPRPPDLVGIALQFFSIPSGIAELKKVALHCTGRLTEQEKTYVPESEHARVFLVAEIWATIYLVVIVACVLTESILPAMFIGLPTFYGAWLLVIFGLTQHAGLAEDVLDHRLNTRTVYMNPIFRFVYWNMNYHVEHHMFPMVPYHALPELHREIKSDLPPVYDGLVEAYREIVPTLLRQVKDPYFHVKRPLPSTAKVSVGAAPV